MDSRNLSAQQIPQQQPPIDAYPSQVPEYSQTENATNPDTFESQSNQQTYQEDPQQDQPQEYEPEQPQQPLFPGVNRPQSEEILFEWQSASRPFKQRNRQYFTTVGLIAALVAVILAFAGQLLVVAVIAAVIFVVYVLNSTPPGLVTHKITTYGIRIEDTLYYWEEMGRFWFSEKYGEDLLHIETSRFPNRLVLLLGNLSKEDMTIVLSEVLLNQEPPPTAYEKAAKWIQEKLPIDLES